MLRQYISNTVVQWLLVDGEVEDFKPQKVIIMMCSALLWMGRSPTSPLQTSNCKTDKRYIVPALLFTRSETDTFGISSIFIRHPQWLLTNYIRTLSESSTNDY
jgi:hypothetical protein